MSRTDDGGPAFPREDYQTVDAPGQRGMSLRDYFAAKVLQGWIATYGTSLFPSGDASAKVAANTYEMADAMLTARKAER